MKDARAARETSNRININYNVERAGSINLAHAKKARKVKERLKKWMLEVLLHIKSSAMDSPVHNFQTI